MASTIKLKNGSGAPLASDLVQGEPALDLTNKRLYTEDSGGTVIEVGTNPTSLTTGDITATGTTTITTADINGGAIDGTTIGGTTTAAGSFTTLQADTSLNVTGTVTADGLTVEAADANTTLTGSTSASIVLQDTGASTNQQVTQLLNNDGDFVIRSLNDAKTGVVATAMTIENLTGNVGIGTQNPAYPLEVAGSFPSISILDTDTTNDRFRILHNSGSSQIQVDPNNVSASSSLLFSIDGSEKVRLDASGNLLVGTTDTFVADNTSGNGLSYRAGIGDLGVAGTNTTPLYANRIGNDGGIVEFRKDGATVGSIGSRSSGTALQIYTSNTGIDFGGDGILPMVGSTITDASRDIGSSSYRFKDLYLSGGVYLGGTGAANHLDDYEEGTWTPQFNDDGGGGDFASSGVTAKYTKVGRLVTIHLWVNGVTNSGSVSISGNLKLDDLPFTCDAGVAGTSIIRARNISSGEVFRAEVSQSTTSIIFYKDSTETRAATSDLLFANGGTNDRVIITLSYLAA